ncbi:MAG TPA: alpha/beta hydrolase, partial [Thermoanaerobaculia bacterium]
VPDLHRRVRILRTLKDERRHRRRADLGAATVPSLILQCSEDAIAPMEVGHYLERTMPGSTLRVMRATGHCPHLSHPEETIAAIRDYLNAA